MRNSDPGHSCWCVMLSPHRNVSEWCEDNWNADYKGAPQDGSMHLTASQEPWPPAAQPRLQAAKSLPLLP